MKNNQVRHCENRSSNNGSNYFVSAVCVCACLFSGLSVSSFVKIFFCQHAEFFVAVVVFVVAKVFFFFFFFSFFFFFFSLLFLLFFFFSYSFSSFSFCFCFFFVPALPSLQQDAASAAPASSRRIFQENGGRSKRHGTRSGAEASKNSQNSQELDPARSPLRPSSAPRPLSPGPE